MDISAEDWPTISALFDEALDLPAGDRRRWLDELTEERRVHRALLEKLLSDHAHVETQDFLGAIPRVGVAAGDAFEGQRQVGPYRLLKEIGRGGMGTVWLAERSDGVLKRQVALKLPHPGLATRAFAERLARERDILASLAHPHIARLYDAGVMAEGQPYIALAYVQGHTLIEHCRAKALGVRERINLFQQVLEAVQYAHAHLVIHRDLKPSNVLVDEHGEVHLLDFGIAKLLVDGQAEATELTLEAGQALTPDYASPEQIAGTAISTASDVYSLGVLLYEVLAGVRPYRLQRQASATLEQALQAIEVPRPSAAALGAGDLPAARALRGDLDTIVLKALQKAPTQRYATADAFSQDLQRHLDAVPVLARPDAMAYRAGKFLRRHRFGVGATALVIASLGAGLAGTAWQARQARQEAQRAQAVQDFLTGMFNEAEPAKAQGRELTARELLDRGQRDLQAKLADQPRLNAELDGVLVDLYAKLGDEAKALPLAEARRDLTLKLGGAQSLEYGDALYSLANIQGGLRRHEQAYKTYTQARDVLQRFTSERQGQLLKLEGHLAYQLSELERFQEASALLSAVAPRLAAHFGPRSWEVIESQALLSHTYSSQGEQARALTIAREIEPLLETVDAGHTLDAAVVRNNLGLAQLAAGHPDEAARSLRGALDAFERLLGSDTTVAVGIQRNLSMALYEQGRFEQASLAFGDNILRAVKVFGEDNPATHLSESYSVRALIMAGHVAEAENMARRSVRAAQGSDGAASALVADFSNRLALALVFAGKAGEAVRLLEGIDAQAAKTGSEKSDMHGRTLLYLAGAQAALGHPQAAVQASARAEQVFAGSAIGHDIYVARAQLTQALALARIGQADRAGPLVAQAEAHLDQAGNPNHPVRLLVQLVRAEVLRGTGRSAEADALEQQSRKQLAAAGATLPKVIPLIF